MPKVGKGEDAVELAKYEHLRPDPFIDQAMAA
jgi:hypothetical protein